MTGDWHIRKDSPIARLETEEEWNDFQFNQIRELIKFCITDIDAAGDFIILIVSVGLTNINNYDLNLND